MPATATGPPHVTASAATKKPATARTSSRRTSRRTPFEARVLQACSTGPPARPLGRRRRLEAAKRTLKEAVVYELEPRPLPGSAPPRGVLLFGPPGTGKTFWPLPSRPSPTPKSFFAASAASLTSKYVEVVLKMVRALFRIARERQPSVIFLDEVDSVLSARGDGDQESSRRMKTEFLVQLDGAGTSREDRILFMAATNRPWDLDDALLRRVPRRVLIPLPDATALAVILDGFDRGDVAQSRLHQTAPRSSMPLKITQRPTCDCWRRTPSGSCGNSRKDAPPSILATWPVQKTDFRTVIEAQRGRVSPQHADGRALARGAGRGARGSRAGLYERQRPGSRA